MSIYSFTAETVDGKNVSLDTYKGKVLMIVNIASACRFTPQLEDLQKLYEKYHPHGFEMLGFPCNQFDNQAPGSNEEVASFCRMNYGVQFPVFAKVEVNGDNAHPLFQYLKNEAPFRGFDESNPVAQLMKKIIMDKYPEYYMGNQIKWNFTKFLVDRQGHVVRRYEPYEEPLDFEQDIAQLVFQ
ncbi:MAG: glutathione peroxidase [Bacillaceae bacterium G1]|nr:glutathione peroxidase [Bacillota bacterium]OJF17814.1 MAG: glutathione peroxidase [Bacillaceae bacterium G1]